MTGLDLKALRKVAEAATQGPWVRGDNWLRAGVTTKFGDGKCAYCQSAGEPERVGRERINGKRMIAHWHRNPEPYEPDHLIETADGTARIAGNYDYEEGGIVHPCDAAYIATFDPPTIMALLDRLEGGGDGAGRPTRPPPRDASPARGHRPALCRGQLRGRRTAQGDTDAGAEERAVLLGYAADMLRVIRAWHNDIDLPEDKTDAIWRATKDILKNCEGIEL